MHRAHYISASDSTSKRGQYLHLVRRRPTESKFARSTHRLQKGKSRKKPRRDTKKRKADRQREREKERWEKIYQVKKREREREESGIKQVTTDRQISTVTSVLRFNENYGVYIYTFLICTLDRQIHVNICTYIKRYICMYSYIYILKKKYINICIFYT